MHNDGYDNYQSRCKHESDDDGDNRYNADDDDGHDGNHVDDGHVPERYRDDDENGCDKSKDHESKDGRTIVGRFWKR